MFTLPVHIPLKRINNIVSDFFSHMYISFTHVKKLKSEFIPIYISSGFLLTYKINKIYTFLCLIHQLTK